MIKIGILNPHILSLIARVRHTNTLVIADRGFPSWPQVETVDLTLVDDIPTVPQVVKALRAHFIIGQTWMAKEFWTHNAKALRDAHLKVFEGIPMVREAHVTFKRRVPHAIGLIRTADTTPYGNVILESA